MMEGITFLGKHSYRDFGLTLAPGRSIEDPSKEKIVVPIAFSNVEYDFSRLYGEQIYTHRKLSYPLNIDEVGMTTKQAMTMRKTAISNWLMNSNGKQPLYDDAMPGYYFLAEVEDGASFSENYDHGILTVTFNAYPFRIAKLAEGNDIWDTFNFELDVAQEVDFTIAGSQQVELYNEGIPSVFPDITASDDMEITFGGRTISVNAGTTKKASVPLVSGKNNLIVTGNGTISFKFHKELI